MPSTANSFPDRNTPGDPRLLDSIAKRTPMIANGGSSQLFNGVVLSPAKQRPVAASSSETCPFGEIITIPDSTDKGIRGGIILCGDQNWNMDPEVIDLGTDGNWLVSIPVSCTANMDDASEILLPGLLTGTRPAGAWTRTAWTEGTDYPSNASPSIPTGEGTIHLPIGKLTVTGGRATLEPVACGGFALSHCAGTLSYIRA